ncbi:MAG: fatty acid desaturase [Nitrospirota bacterium]|nr:fatty acid desaturase [Nitrospirota bacterium]
MTTGSTSARPSRRVNWPTTLFLFITPPVAISGTVWWVASGQFNRATLALFFLTWAATAMGITGGYHRLFSHRAYEASGPLRMLFLLGGGAAWEGSVLEWCRDHRRHHRFVDTERDPYNIGQGFWWAHMLWLVFNRREPVNPEEVPDLYADRWIRLQHRYYVWIAIGTSFLLPIALCALWGDLWGGLFVATTLRIVVNHHATFLINSLSHIAGSQPYSDSHSARDNWFTALLTYGEGYHNYHHEFPSDYRNGIRPWQWDPTKWLIWSCSRLSLAHSLRRVDPEKITAKRLEMQEKHLAERLRRFPGALTGVAQQTLGAAREQVHQSVERLVQLRAQYQRLKHDLRSGTTAELHRQVAELHGRVHHAEHDLATTMATWQSAVRGITRTAA